MYKIGKGLLINENGTKHYFGSIPDIEEDEEVIILRKKDLDTLIQVDTNSLLVTRTKMPKELYDKVVVQDSENQYNISAPLVDEIFFNTNEEEKHKLFLDRNLYGTDFKEEVWVRYVSVEKSLKEENFVDGESNGIR